MNFELAPPLRLGISTPLFPIKSPMMAHHPTTDPTTEHFGGDWIQQLIALTRAISRFAASTIICTVVAVTVAAIEEVWSFWTVRLVGNLPHKSLVGNLPNKR
jgi:hypothetical protein